VADNDLAALVSPEVAAAIANKRAARQPGDFEVLPENWTAVRLFVDCATQWQINPMGGVMGLRYEAVDIVIRRGGYEPLAPDDWQRLQTLERVAVNELKRE
jgi:hypothetical protein